MNRSDHTPKTLSATAEPAAKPAATPHLDRDRLLADIRRWGAELGFTGLGVAPLDLAADEAHLLDWLR